MSSSIEQSRPYTDQRAGLIVFGSMQILAGLGFLAMAGLMILVLGSDLATGAGSIVQAAAVYAVVAASAVCLGIGSIMCQRWARDLTLVMSWIALVVGAFVTVMLALIMPRISSSVPDGGDSLPGVVIVISVGVIALFWVGVPALFAWFYGREATRLTCQARDPKQRWTERIPLPLLAAAIVLLWSGASTLFSLANPILPLGSSILRGVPARVIFVASGTITIVLAIGLLRRSRAAWVALMVFFVLGVLVAAWTFSAFDPEAFYAAMSTEYTTDVPPELFDIYASPLVLGIFALAAVAWLTFMFSLRRYMTPAERSA